MAATVRPRPRYRLPPPEPVGVYSELFYMAEGRWKSLRKMNDSLTSYSWHTLYCKPGRAYARSISIPSRLAPAIKGSPKVLF